MATKAQQEQAAKLAALHLTWRDPKRTHPERVETFTKEWTTKKGEARAKKLDYVGHANLRDILCYADPLWTWQHGGYDANGHRVPLIDRDGQGRARGIWIDLTVYGVTKPGYGTVAADVDAMNAMKELIGDALRNAAQSFGIAVALWARIELAELEAHYGQDAELHGQDAPQDAPAATTAPEDQPPPAAPEKPAQPPQEASGGQCPECHAPAGKGHGTACSRRGGNGQSAVKPALTPESQPDPTPPPAAEGQLEGEELRLEVGRRLNAMRGQTAIAFAEEKRRAAWPDDLTGAADDTLRDILEWLRNSPVERVAGGA